MSGRSSKTPKGEQGRRRRRRENGENKEETKEENGAETCLVQVVIKKQTKKAANETL